MPPITQPIPHCQASTRSSPCGDQNKRSRNGPFRPGCVLPNKCCAQLLSPNEKLRKIKLAERTAKREAILQLPMTQSREIFSLSFEHHNPIPLVRLPVPGAALLADGQKRRNSQSAMSQDNLDADDDESDDSDGEEDVEALFLELAHELDKEAHTTPTTIALPQSVFFSPSHDYFSPGAPFLTAMTHQAPMQSHVSVGHEAPTLSVRIGGGDMVQNVYLSPGSSASDKESFDTHSMPDEHAFSLHPPPYAKNNASIKRNSSSSSSAVSPQFMALKKLSHGDTQTTDMLQHYTDGFEKSLLQKIDTLIKSRLQANIQRSQQEAQRFWEEQRREMAELGSAIMAKLDRAAAAVNPMNTMAGAPPVTAPKPNPEQDVDHLRQKQIDLENEINEFRLKQIALRRQLFEMELVKAHNAELEKQYNEMRKRYNELEAQHQERQRALESRIAELEAEIAQLKEHKPKDWADVVEEELANNARYQELEARYHAMEADLTERIRCLELENKKLSDARRRTVHPHMMPAEISSTAVASSNHSASRATMPSPPPPAVPPPSAENAAVRKELNRRSYYLNSEGHLTFTTEINGHLSEYTIKLPKAAMSHPTSAFTTKNAKGDKNANSTKSTPAVSTSKLNPNAPSWNGAS